MNVFEQSLGSLKPEKTEKNKDKDDLKYSGEIKKSERIDPPKDNYLPKDKFLIKDKPFIKNSVVPKEHNYPPKDKIKKKFRNILISCNTYDEVCDNGKQPKLLKIFNHQNTSFKKIFFEKDDFYDYLFFDDKESILYLFNEYYQYDNFFLEIFSFLEENDFIVNIIKNKIEYVFLFNKKYPLKDIIEKIKKESIKPPKDIKNCILCPYFDLINSKCLLK